MENNSILYERQEDCCGCGTCKVTCPRHAITMEIDTYGFIYPVIASESCINCGMCRKVCAYQQRQESNSPRKVYAMSLKNIDMVWYKKS